MPLDTSKRASHLGSWGARRESSLCRRTTQAAVCGLLTNGHFFTNLPMLMKPSPLSQVRSGFRGALALLVCTSLGLYADQVPNPSITASARPYNPSYAAGSLFDAANAEFASLGQGPVSAP